MRPEEVVQLLRRSNKVSLSAATGETYHFHQTAYSHHSKEDTLGDGLRLHITAYNKFVFGTGSRDLMFYRMPISTYEPGNTVVYEN